ncbi:ecdysone-induced protein 74EF-like [Drosophila novamexicana]|uniref:ecdysone-induced protein 74EF-like n=1 Tax=Drosophila novamexicana TaxID=47314 RepID=UPI0011E5B5B1|nr:ecdysone-induced protein 74EF-like [Drosophila novamexicana]
MPFIDDALLWCPDNDGRLVGGLDLATCITDDSTVNAENINPTVGANNTLQQQQQQQLQQQQLQHDSSDELFRTLSESNFEIESLLSDLATVEVKVENEENNNNNNNVVISDNDFASVAAAVVAGDDLLAKDNVQLSVQGLVDSVGASLADSGSGNGHGQALLAFGSSSATATAAKRNGFLLPCDLLNNNNNNSNGNGNGNGECTPEESRFVTVTSASANPLLVEKLMSKCLNIDKRLDKLDVVVVVVVVVGDDAAIRMILKGDWRRYPFPPPPPQHSKAIHFRHFLTIDLTSEPRRCQQQEQEREQEQESSICSCRRRRLFNDFC